MWGRLDDNDQLVNGMPVEILRRARGLTFTVDGEEYNAPRDWNTKWSQAEIEERHIFPLVTTLHDKKWGRINGEPTYLFDGVVITETYPTAEISIERAVDIVMDKLNIFAANKRDNGFVFNGNVFSSDSQATALNNLVYAGGQGNAPFSSNFGMRTKDMKQKVLLNTVPLKKAFGEALIEHMDDTNEAYDEHITWVNDPIRTFAELKAHDVQSTLTTEWPIVPLPEPEPEPEPLPNP